MNQRHVSIGIIGYGYWGKKVATAFHTHPNCHVKRIVDTSSRACDDARVDYPLSQVSQHVQDIIDDNEIQIVAVVTPLETHFSLGKDVLLANKHLFIEKPYTTTLREALYLKQLSEKNNTCVMVDSVFLFSDPIHHIKSLIETQQMGTLLSITGNRSNLGKFQDRLNVLWDLAPHDITILNYLLNQLPVSISALGCSQLHPTQTDLATLILRYKSGLEAHLFYSWIAPKKTRLFTINGSQKQLLWDDTHPTHAIEFSQNNITENNVQFNANNTRNYIPTQQENRLENQIHYFLNCVHTKTAPINSSTAGCVMTGILETAQESLVQKGRSIRCPAFPFSNPKVPPLPRAVQKGMTLTRQVANTHV